MICPNCQSDQVRKLSLIYEEGLSDIKMSSETFAAGTGGTAFGVTSTEGVSQSALSQEAAPPKKENTIKLLLMHVVGFFVLNIIMGILIKGSSVIAGIVNVGYLALVVFHIYSNIKFNRHEYPALLQNWQSSYMSLKCGNAYIP